MFLSPLTYDRAPLAEDYHLLTLFHVEEMLLLLHESLANDAAKIEQQACNERGFHSMLFMFCCYSCYMFDIRHNAFALCRGVFAVVCGAVSQTTYRDLAWYQSLSREISSHVLFCFFCSCLFLFVLLVFLFVSV